MSWLARGRLNRSPPTSTAFYSTVSVMARNKKGYKRASAPKKPPLTHFLCLPLVTPDSKPQLEASLDRFREAVAIKDPASASQVETQGEDVGPTPEMVVPGVHPKAIRPVGALHCTLGVMSLDEEELQEATELLRGLDVAAMVRDARKEQADAQQPASSDRKEKSKSEAPPSSLAKPISPPPIEPAISPLTIDFKGLVSMHSPHSTSVLYSAPSDSSGRLYPFCLALQKLFAGKEFLVKDDRTLKLHATIVNTIYAKGRKDRSAGHGPNANAPLKIDATAILERFQDFIWAKDVVLDRIAICEMGAKKMLDEKGDVIAEEYTEVASVKLPT